MDSTTASSPDAAPRAGGSGGSAGTGGSGGVGVDARGTAAGGNPDSVDAAVPADLAGAFDVPTPFEATPRPDAAMDAPLPVDATPAGPGDGSVIDVTSETGGSPTLCSPVLRQPVIQAPTGGDSGRKVMPTACSRASTPTSGARSVSEWGCILPVRRARPPMSVASEWRRLIAVRPRSAGSGGAGRRLRAARLSGPCSAAGRLSAPARLCPERGEFVTCGNRQSKRSGFDGDGAH